MGHDITWICDWCGGKSKTVTNDIVIKGTHSYKLQLGTDEICKRCVDQVIILKKELKGKI